MKVSGTSLTPRTKPPVSTEYVPVKFWRTENSLSHVVQPGTYLYIH